MRITKEEKFLYELGKHLEKFPDTQSDGADILEIAALCKVGKKAVINLTNQLSRGNYIKETEQSGFFTLTVHGWRTYEHLLKELFAP